MSFSESLKTKINQKHCHSSVFGCQPAFCSSRHRLLIEGQNDDNVCAFAALAGDFQFSAHLFNPLPHPGETQTVTSMLKVKSGAIIPQLQTNSLAVAG